MTKTDINFIDAFFPQKSVVAGMPRKTVISGSTNGIRTEIAARIIARTVGGGYPVIIVHRSNARFIEAYASNGAAFDPMLSLNDAELASMLLEVGKSIAGMSVESKVIISIGLEVMRALSIERDFNAICTFPWETISEFIFNCATLPDDYKLKLIQRIEPFSMQIPAVASLFTELSVHAFDKCCPQDTMSKQSQGLFSGNSVTAIDIGSDVNTTFTELVLSVIKLQKEKGHKFLTVLDSLPIPHEHSISFWIHKSTDVQTPVVILSPDLAQTIAGRSNMFNDIVGSGVNAIVLSHSAGSSADVWSSFFGEYYYQRRDTTTGETKEKYTFFKASQQKSVTETEERRRYVPAEEIMLLTPSCAFARFGANTDSMQPFEMIEIRKGQN